VRSKTGNLFLTEAQAACLLTLQAGKDAREVAIGAKLPLPKTATALAALAELGFVARDDAKGWHATDRGRASQFATVADPPKRQSAVPGSNGQRLLEILVRPMAVAEIERSLGLSNEGVRQLLIRLHAQGLVKLGNPESPFRLVARAGDPTPLLSRSEERVLSAIPADYATDATKIRLSVKMPEERVQPILESLTAHGLVEALDGWQGRRLYRIAAIGLEHPQRRPLARLAKAARLGVESDRVHEVLFAIDHAGALRIKEVGEAAGVPHQSINALMQYLKRKQLVKKIGDTFGAPYCLTDYGQAALAEMARRRAA
jgi:DNA-binding IclR family transcriptional regulator